MNKKEKTPSSSSPSGTNKKDDNETIALEEEEEEEGEEEELPKSKLHEEMMEIYNCYNANCLALEADPEKKDNWQSSKKYPGEVLCVKCSNDEKRAIAEKKKLAKEASRGKGADDSGNIEATALTASFR
jgi:phosphatidate phosphatase PAH1